MKKLLTVLAASVAIIALAASPSYDTKNASGTTTATVVFPAKPGKQIRIVGAIATSDKAASVFSFRTGGAAYRLLYGTNNSATHYIVSTNAGLATSDVLLLQKADGTTASAVVSSVSNGTNVIVSSSFGVAVTTNDTIYELSSATTIKCGATTATYQGEAIYVGAQNRPVRIVLDGTSACSLDSITARYE